MNLEHLLEQVANGTLAPAEAFEQLQKQSADLGFARLDLGREARCGLPEFVFAEGKTPEQVTEIFSAFRAAGQNALATRVTPELYAAVQKAHPEAVYHPSARILILETTEKQPPVGRVMILAAGTADLPVAEEAALTAEYLGARVERLYDIGVAGLHRLTEHLDRLRNAHALVVVAGMEGALPSVVGGLVDTPLIAVPTSVGYGLHFNGLAALLAMLNSCVPGITVVNVNNGLGAGAAAARINRQVESA